MIVSRRRGASGPPPTLVQYSVDPAITIAGLGGPGTPFKILGTNLSVVTAVELRATGSVGAWSACSGVSSTPTTVTATPPVGMPVNVYDVRVTTPNGQASLIAAYAADNFLFLLDADVASSIHIVTGVSQWDDILVGGWLGNVLQGTGGSQPTDTAGAINGRHALLFSGGQVLQKSGLVDQAQPVFIDLVGHQIGAGTYAYWDGASGVISTEAQYSAGNIGYYAGVTVVAGAADPVTNPFQLNVQYNGVSSFARFNRAGLTSGDPGALALQGGLTVGGLHGFTALYDGYIASMLGYSGVMPTNVRDVIEQWRKWKWGLV